MVDSSGNFTNVYGISVVLDNLAKAVSSHGPAPIPIYPGFSFTTPLVEVSNSYYINVPVPPNVYCVGYGPVPLHTGSSFLSNYWGCYDNFVTDATNHIVAMKQVDFWGGQGVVDQSGKPIPATITQKGYQAIEVGEAWLVYPMFMVRDGGDGYYYSGTEAGFPSLILPNGMEISNDMSNSIATAVANSAEDTQPNIIKNVVVSGSPPTQISAQLGPNNVPITLTVGPLKSASLSPTALHLSTVYTAPGGRYSANVLVTQNGGVIDIVNPSGAAAYQYIINQNASGASVVSGFQESYVLLNDKIVVAYDSTGKKVLSGTPPPPTMTHVQLASALDQAVGFQAAITAAKSAGYLVEVDSTSTPESALIRDPQTTALVAALSQQ